MKKEILVLRSKNLIYSKEFEDMNEAALYLHKVKDLENTCKIRID